MTCAPFMFAPEANALAETGTAGTSIPGNTTVVVGVEAGVGVGCIGTGDVATPL